jgi:hypothetical protein
MINIVKSYHTKTKLMQYHTSYKKIDGILFGMGISCENDYSFSSLITRFLASKGSCWSPPSDAYLRLDLSMMARIKGETRDVSESNRVMTGANSTRLHPNHSLLFNYLDLNYSCNLNYFNWKNMFWVFEYWVFDNNTRWFNLVLSAAGIC